MPHVVKPLLLLVPLLLFLTWAFDQIRMGVIPQTSISLIGSHWGVSVCEDGPSQMALEDLAMFRSIPNCTVFYPSDAISTEHAVYLAANMKRMCFVGTSWPETAVIYTPQESFEIGPTKVIRHSVNDKVTVTGAGVTLHEALAATDLFQQGISIRIIDPFTIEPWMLPPSSPTQKRQVAGCHSGGSLPRRQPGRSCLCNCLHGAWHLCSSSGSVRSASKWET